MKPKQNDHRLTDDIFSILQENSCIVIQISIKCVPWEVIDITPVLIRVMAWQLSGATP